MIASTPVQLESRKAGKGSNRSNRLLKKIPAVVYGPKMKNKNVLVDELFVLRHSGARHESSIFQVESADKDLSALKVMIKSIHMHPSSGRPLHVDLYALDMNAMIRVNVSIQFVGEPRGVKEEGGVVQIILREIEVECKPTEIPESIPVDISGLAAGESLHVSDVSFPSGVKPMTLPERTIVTVNIPREEKAAEEAPAAVAATAAPAAAPAKS